MGKPKYKTLSFMGYSAYQVGDDGSVWTRLKHIGTGKGGGKGAKYVLGGTWKRLRCSTSPKGYKSIFLYQGVRKKRIAVHNLVLLAFVGPRPPGHVSRHFPDHDPSNNKLKNLSWSTVSQNSRDREYQGSLCHGEDLPQSKLTECDVMSIRDDYKNGKASLRMLATQYGVCLQNIHHIVRRVTWKHV
jgi:hypothetical protein